jgi:LysR family transcriptional regulator for metE and metH
LQAFQEKFPRVDVCIVAKATGRPVEALLDGELDLAIISDPVKNRKVALDPLFDDELFLITAPNHPLARRSFVTAEDLADEHLILYCDDKRDLTLYQQVLLPAGVTPRRHTAVQLTEAILEMVKAGLGVSAMAGWAIAPYVKSKQVRAVRLTRGGVHRHWKAATLRGSQKPKYIRDFIKLASTTAPRPLRWAAA